MKGLGKQSRTFYRRFYRLTTISVIVMMAVLTGSLVLGDSVRGTLVSRVDERLGGANTVISSGSGFIAGDLMKQSLFVDAQAYLMTEGFVSVSGKLIPVTVWGVDDDRLQTGDAWLNESLQKEIGSVSPVVLHLPTNPLIPSGSLFVSQSYSTQLRLSVAGIKKGDDGGNLLLHNEQVQPLNIFVNRGELAEAMELGNEVNIILSPNRITEKDFAYVWNPEYSGIRKQGNTVTSARGFMPQHIVEAFQSSDRIFSYFVNSIGDIPYSFVTATERLEKDDAVLSDYTARRLDVSVGDTVKMTYFVSKGLKQLETRTHRFRVKQIEPLALFQSGDFPLADFPGLSNVDNCNDWDSDLPIDMDRIGQLDRDYWDAYRQTPKAWVSYEAVQADWSNAFGVATAVESALSPKEVLTPQMVGISVLHPREDAMSAAKGGIDFASLFLALGFFIIIAGMLLMLNPLAEMYLLRHQETELYTALGYSSGQIVRRFFNEALPVVLRASILGILSGYLYAAVSLWMLGHAWNGATHTDGFRICFRFSTLLVGWVAGFILSLSVLWYAVRKNFKRKNRSGKEARKPGRFLPAFTLLLALATSAVSYGHLHSITGFVLSGLSWLLCAGLFVRRMIGKQSLSSPFTQDDLVRIDLATNRPQQMLAFWTLAAGIFVLFSVSLNRPDFEGAAENLTGSYAIYAESRIPLQYDLNNPDVRKHLALKDLPEFVRFLQLHKHIEDDASCLNLNKVSVPTVLGMPRDQMAVFGIDSAICDKRQSGLIPVVVDEETLMWSLQKSVGDTLSYRTQDGQTIPVLIAAACPSGIFHGNVIMEDRFFQELWPEESGSRVILASHDVSDLMRTALSEYGLRITTVSDRLRLFFEVTDAYLRIFLALSGLGLLLGIFSLVIVIRKNLAARKDECELYRTLGFSDRFVVRLLRRENLPIPIFALISGTAASMISVSAGIAHLDADVIIEALGLFVILMVTLGLLIYKTIHLNKQLS